VKIVPLIVIDSPLRVFQWTLRWSSYVAPTHLKRSQERKTAVCRVQCRASLEQSVLRRSLVWKLSATKLYGKHWLNNPWENDWSESNWKFGLWWPTRLQCAHFSAIPLTDSPIIGGDNREISTNSNYTTRFQLRLRWTSYFLAKLHHRPKMGEGAHQQQNFRHPCKITPGLKTVCYEVSLCENCQRQTIEWFMMTVFFVTSWRPPALYNLIAGK